MKTAIQSQEILNFIIKKAKSSLKCYTGTLWLTRSGDPCDYFLNPGESFDLEPGHWVCQTLRSPAVLELTNRNEKPAEKDCDLPWRGCPPVQALP